MRKTRNTLDPTSKTQEDIIRVQKLTGEDDLVQQQLYQEGASSTDLNVPEMDKNLQVAL